MQNDIYYGLLTASHVLHAKILAVAAAQKTHVDARIITPETIDVAAQEMYNSGVNAFISGPHFSRVLRERYPIPVLSIPIGLDDLIPSLMEARKYESPIMVLLYDAWIDSMNLVETLIDRPVVQQRYNSTAERDASLDAWKQSGNKVVVAGGSALSACLNRGLVHVNYHLSANTILKMFQNTENLVRRYIDVNNEFERYKSIINTSDEGFIAVSPEQIITIYNKYAESLFGIPCDSVIGKDIHSLENDAISEAVQQNNRNTSNITSIGGKKFVVRGYPVFSGHKHFEQKIGMTVNIRKLSSVMSDAKQAQRLLTRRLTARYSIDDLVFQSPQMAAIVAKVKSFSPSESAILICGDSGTGKEILAHGIHSLSRRQKGPFVSINCASIPEHLLESELFGYEEGAFTGARRGGKSGLFELAHNGTLFLDEVNSLPLSLQGKLLRAIEAHEIMRVGGDSIISVSVRIVAAANRHIPDAVRAGTFREDLFFRLNILNITVPPLRERLEDIPLLSDMLLRRSARSLGIAQPAMPPQCIEALKRLPWPGNVRQLSGFIERFVLLTGGVFDESVFNQLYKEEIDYSIDHAETIHDATQKEDSLKIIHREAKNTECKLIQKTLEELKWNKTRVAEKLGISRATLHRKLKDLGIC